MIRNTLVRPHARLVYGYRLRPARLPSLPKSSNRALGREEKDRDFEKFEALFSGPDSTALKTSILKSLCESLVTKHDAFKERNPKLYWALTHCDVVFIAGFLVLISSPFLFGWPSLLKSHIKSGTWALLRDRTEEALVHTSNAWYMIQLLPSEALSPDSNLKILKVASLHAWALLKGGQKLEAFRIMSDALTLRRRRMEEERRKYENNGSNSVMSVSKDERMFVITLCLLLGNLANQLGPGYDNDGCFYLAYAYAESLRLSRSRHISSRQRQCTSPPLDAEPLKVAASELGLDPEPDIFEKLEEDEICHDSSWWQDIMFQKPSAKFSCPGQNLMSMSAANMGELCEKLGHHDLAYAFHLNAAKATSDSIPGSLPYVIRAFHSALNYRDSPAQSALEEVHVPSVEEVVERCKEIEQLANELDSNTWEGSPTGKDIYNFFSTFGRAYQNIGQQEEAHQKFKRGLEIAGQRGFGQEAKENLRKLHPQLVSCENLDVHTPATSDSDATSHIFDL